jgi:hypothetical protein
MSQNSHQEAFGTNLAVKSEINTSQARTVQLVDILVELNARAAPRPVRDLERESKVSFQALCKGGWLFFISGHVPLF